MGGCARNGLPGSSDRVPGSLCKSFQNKMEGPGYSAGEAMAANQICQSIELVGRDESRTAVWSPGFALKLVLFPFGIAVMTDPLFPRKQFRRVGVQPCRKLVSIYKIKRDRRSRFISCRPEQD